MRGRCWTEGDCLSTAAFVELRLMLISHRFAPANGAGNLTTRPEAARLSQYATTVGVDTYPARTHAKCAGQHLGATTLYPDAPTATATMHLTTAPALTEQASSSSPSAGPGLWEARARAPRRKNSVSSRKDVLTSKTKHKIRRAPQGVHQQGQQL